MRNRLIELIQYDAATQTVHPEPVLIVPSWIMKYYILDLSPHNSLVQLPGRAAATRCSWCRGATPAPRTTTCRWTTTCAWACFAALEAVRKRAAARRRARDGLLPGRHAAGDRRGGAGARRPKRRSKTLTLLAAQTDFNEPGELGLFIDESQIAFLEDLMTRTRLPRRPADGRRLRADQLARTWCGPSSVHEYLMGAHDAADRPARLERRRHAHAGAHAQRIPAPPVPAQRPGRGPLPRRRRGRWRCTTSRCRCSWWPPSATTCRPGNRSTRSSC